MLGAFLRSPTEKAMTRSQPRSTPAAPLSVSEVEIVPIKPKDGLVAFASCLVNGQLYLGDIAIHTRPDGTGFRLVYPAKTLPHGKTINAVHPVTKEAGETIHRAVIARFQQLITKNEAGQE